MGDGEMDEPESLGAIALAGREQLDNLVFVINCNLQRLDGPCGAMERSYRNLRRISAAQAGTSSRCCGERVGTPCWRRISTAFFASEWRSASTASIRIFKSKNGAYVREHFFGKYPELAAMVADLSDAEIWKLTRGGHDPGKVYAAYKAASEHNGQPTLILAKTVKGYGMGEAGEGQMIKSSSQENGS